ncbi:MAG: hypothetical protein M0Z87_12565 [Actinomycetota bacterium]|nr:hypothetical protein [Actinomycetota bacterium]
MNGYIEAGYVVALVGVGGYGAAVAARRRKLEKVLGLTRSHAAVEASGRKDRRPGRRSEGLR